MINQDPPATCSDEVQDAIAAASEELGLSTKRMVSRAYHDSLFMARWGLMTRGKRNGSLGACLLHCYGRRTATQSTVAASGCMAISNTTQQYRQHKP
jgi:hypothetical protein